MEQYYEEISSLVQGLLIPARVEKKIDNDVYEKFCEILIELAKKVKGTEYIPRRIAGLLYFISTSLSNEASFCKYDDELFLASAKIDELIDEVLWDSPLKS